MCRHFLCVTKFYSWMKRVQNVGAIGELCKLRCLDAIRMLSVVLGRAGRVWIRLVWVNAHWWSHMESKLVNDHVSLGALGIFLVKKIYIYLSIYLSLSLHMHWISPKLRRRFPHCSWGLSGLALVWPTREIGLGGESQRGRYQVPRSTLGRAPVGWRWLWWMPVKWPCLMGRKCWNMLINHQIFGQPIVQANPSVDMFVYVVVNAPLGG
jgi:hypothetical protein